MHSLRTVSFLRSFATYALFLASFLALSALPLLAAQARAQALSLGLSGEAAVDAGPIILTRESAEAELSADAFFMAQASATTSAASESVSDEQMLRMHAALVTAEDERMQSVALSEEKVELTYRYPAKLFGFIRASLPVTVSVNADGAAEITYPWYGAFFSFEEEALLARVEAAAEEEIYASASPELTFPLQARVLDTLAAAVAAEGEAALEAELR